MQVAVYRCVAEGVTNALRHASASSISVTVARRRSCVSVDVVDDGAGGAVVPGVGLSSLAARAERRRQPARRPTRAAAGHPSAPRAARGFGRMTTPREGMSIGVLVVDDHPVVLTGLAALISSDPGLRVVGTARSCAAARELPDDVTPDVAVLDLQLPDGDGIALGAELKRRWPGLRVLILTMHAGEATVIESLASGLDGYLLKDADPEDVLAAVHSAAGGSLVVGKGAAAAVVAAAASAPRTDALSVLDARDLEILELLVAGLPTSQVASRLYLAPKTIRNRISSILAKLGVATRDEAVAMARTAGLGDRRRG